MCWSCRARTERPASLFPTVRFSVAAGGGNPDLQAWVGPGFPPRDDPRMRAVATGGCVPGSAIRIPSSRRVRALGSGWRSARSYPRHLPSRQTAVAMDVLQAKLRHRHRSGFNRAGGEAGLRTWSLLCIYPWCVYTLAPITVVTNTLSSFRLTPSPRPGVEESG